MTAISHEGNLYLNCSLSLLPNWLCAGPSSHDMHFCVSIPEILSKAAKRNLYPASQRAENVYLSCPTEGSASSVHPLRADWDAGLRMPDEDQQDDLNATLLLV